MPITIIAMTLLAASQAEAPLPPGPPVVAQAPLPCEVCPGEVAGATSAGYVHAGGCRGLGSGSGLLAGGSDCQGWGGPGLGFFLGVGCRMRCYTAMHAAYYRRPFDYRRSFDYPWGTWSMSLARPLPLVTGQAPAVGDFFRRPGVPKMLVQPPLPPDSLATRKRDRARRNSAIKVVD